MLGLQVYYNMNYNLTFSTSKIAFYNSVGITLVGHQGYANITSFHYGNQHTLAIVFIFLRNKVCTYK